VFTITPEDHNGLSTDSMVMLEIKKARMRWRSRERGKKKNIGGNLFLKKKVSPETPFQKTSTGEGKTGFRQRQGRGKVN
jgi:hypothetical protein